MKWVTNDLDLNASREEFMSFEPKEYKLTSIRIATQLINIVINHLMDALEIVYPQY
jgi:hypothetical protein